jgi:hypothetical protein
VTHAFNSFGLTILTQTRQFDDNAAEGRSIPHFSEITNLKIPTVEPDEMLKEGIELQNMLLYLRMGYYKEISIDKTQWLEGLQIHV